MNNLEMEEEGLLLIEQYTILYIIYLWKILCTWSLNYYILLLTENDSTYILIINLFIFL